MVERQKYENLVPFFQIFGENIQILAKKLQKSPKNEGKMKKVGPITSEYVPIAIEHHLLS